MDPATGAIDSLLLNLKSLLSSVKLRKKARKEVIFLQEKLTRMQLAFKEADPLRLSLQIKEWLRQARPLSYGIEHVVDKFEARRLKAAHPPAADRHQLIRKIRFQMAIAKASGQFATDIQSYRGRIMELDIQLIIRMDPAEGAIDSLLPKLQGLLTSGKLRKKARKEVAFLQEKLTRIHGALGQVEDVEGVTQARALSYSIEKIVDKFHALTRNIRLQLAFVKASRQLAKDFQSYRDPIVELDLQLAVGMGPARGAIDSLLPKLEDLLTSGKLRKKARKEVVFLQEKLTVIHDAFGKVVKDLEWARQARALSYRIEYVVDKLIAHQQGTAGIDSIRFKMVIAKASDKFVKDIQGYRDRIMELDIQLISYTVPETGAIDSLLPKLNKLLITRKLWKKARKEAVFLQEKLTSIQHAFGKINKPADQLSVQMKEWIRQCKVLSYDIEHVVHEFMAHRLRSVDPLASDRHKLIGRIKFKMVNPNASRQFAKDIQSYRGRIMEMEKQLIVHMGPARGAMDSLLPKLDELLISGKLRKEAENEVVFLREKLTRIQLAFGEVEDMPGDQLSVRIKERARRARALSYDIEQVVDKFMAHRPWAADRHKLIGRIRLKMVVAKASSKFAKDIQSYRDSVMELDIAPSSPSRSPSPTHDDFSNTAAPIPSPRHDTAIAANDHDGTVDELVDPNVLVNRILADEHGEGITSNRQPMIASILGGAGVGKTKLVDQVYQQLNSLFECTAWVTVSQEPDIKNVLWNILCQISLQDDATFGSLTVKETINEIRKALNNKRYFIVVEDLWDITEREIIKCALIENSKGSVILMTSHSVSVARFPGVKIYHVGPLSENSSRELFGAGDNCRPDLVTMPEKIVKRSIGIPSAISNATDLPAVEAKESWHTMLDSSNSEDSYDVGMTSQQLGEDNLSELMRRNLTEALKIDAALSCRVEVMGHESTVSMSAEGNSVSILNKQEDQPLPETVGQLTIQGHNVDLPQEQLFGAGDSCPPDSVDITEEISEECSGTPSAISSAANLPAGEAKEGRITMLESSNSEDPNAMRSENLSHTVLPEPLKSCLLYLSMFRNGYEISEDRLISGWIAERYIHEHAAGEECLKDLTERDLIEAVKIDADGKALCCLNDKGRELIASFSAEENSVTILKKRQGQPLPHTIGRLAVQGHDVDLAQEQVSIVRSLVVSDVDLASSSNHENSGATVMPFLSRFANLRVLELGGCGSLQNDHLDGIKSLLLLRYLVIGGGITGIPENIDSLVFLQTLDLRATSVEELPGTIVRARQLKCLRVNGRTKMPRGIGKMVALQELGDMNISNAELLKELSGLTNLTILGIVIWSWDDGYMDALLDYLRSLSEKNLKSLSIFTCCSLHILGRLKAENASKSLQKLEIRRSAFLSLPVWISSLYNLSSISIEVYKLSQEIINILGEMENLLALSLKSKQAPVGTFTNAGFESLTSFSFVTNAVGKIFELGAMEKVERLHLSFHASRAENGFDFGLQYLASLKYAHVEVLCFNANLEMVEKARKAIEKAIDDGCTQRSKDRKLDFELLDKIESGTQAEHDTIQENQHSSPSTSAPASKKKVASNPAQFCDRCGSEFAKAEYQFCPGCGTRRLTVQKK